ncbi:MAG: hypothetical protein ACYTHM_01475 [Planctomycetota bacterium]|jgi:prophage DNA circulation protein
MTMKKKGGLVDRILSSAHDEKARTGKVQRKRITLDDLKRVIEEYVEKTAGMGDPELRSRLIHLELQMGTIREQNASLQKSLASAREGWKSAQEELAALAQDRSGLSGETAKDLAKARAEVLESLEEIARLKGKIAAAEMSAEESKKQLEPLREKAKVFAEKLELARRKERKLKSEAAELTAKLHALTETHRKEVESLTDRIDLLSTGFDHMDLLPPLDWDALTERAKSASLHAEDLSVGADETARAILETTAERCRQIRLELEGERTELEGKLRTMEEQMGDYQVILRITEIQHNVHELSTEIGFLEMILSFLEPSEEAA